MDRADAKLTIIAVEIGTSNHGDFLKHLAAAWQIADRGNKSFMRSFWTLIVGKYGLFQEYAGAIEEHMEEYLEEEK